MSGACPECGCNPCAKAYYCNVAETEAPTYVVCGYCDHNVPVGEDCPCLSLHPGKILLPPGDRVVNLVGRGTVTRDGVTRIFDTGGIRSSDTGRYDPEGFLSPLVLERFCEYMQKHRLLPDGSERTSDNWQKGMPRDSYMKGLLRHVLHAWSRHRGYEVRDVKATASLEEDLLAVLFNVQGYLFELLLKR